MPRRVTNRGEAESHSAFIPWEAEVFFRDHPQERALYSDFSAFLHRLVPDACSRVNRTHLSFFLDTMFLAVWLLPRKKAKPRIILALSLGRPAQSDRVMASTQVSKARWTVHIPVEDVKTLDEELAGWILEAAEKAKGH